MRQKETTDGLQTSYCCVNGWFWKFSDKCRWNPWCGSSGNEHSIFHLIIPMGLHTQLPVEIFSCTGSDFQCNQICCDNGINHELTFSSQGCFSEPIQCGYMKILQRRTGIRNSVNMFFCICIISSDSGIAKPRHTRARARATFACALAFACRSFKLALHMKESARDWKRLSWELNSNESASGILEMCSIFATLTWPENPADAIPEVQNLKIFLGGHAPRLP